jgi:transposase InsO family protein
MFTRHNWSNDGKGKYILTVQDDLSKFLVAISIPQQGVETVAKEFVFHIVLKFGALAQILTDQGSDFLSNLFKITCKLLKIEKIQTVVYHQELNGCLEGSHWLLAEYLQHYVHEDETNWDE